MCIVLQVWLLKYFISNTNEKHLSRVSLSGAILVASSGRYSFGSLTWELTAVISCSVGGWMDVRIHLSTRRSLWWSPPPRFSATPCGPWSPHWRGFTIKFWHITLGRTPLDEWSARRRDLYLTIHSTHKRQTSLPPAGFEHAIPASERPQTHALDGAVAGIGLFGDSTLECTATASTCFSIQHSASSRCTVYCGLCGWITGCYSEVGHDFLLESWNVRTHYSQHQCVSHVPCESCEHIISVTKFS